jgi:hypothetical protein
MHHRALAYDNQYHKNTIDVCRALVAYTPLKGVVRLGNPRDEEEKTTECYGTAHCATGRLREDRNFLEWVDTIGYC